MRAVVQRVSRASVTVGGETIAEIGKGVLVLLGVGKGDGDDDAAYLARKTADLRVFEDEARKMNLSLLQIGGEALVVSQFTLFGNCRKGRRPSFVAAAEPAEAERLYETYAARLHELGLVAKTGRFAAMMDVALVNDGPVTILLDSRKLF